MQEEVRLKRCGDNNMHWIGEGNTCLCGQVPWSIFFAVNCTCGAYRYINPEHKPDCAYVEWAKKRNYWVQQHPNLKPPLGKVRLAVEIRINEPKQVNSSLLTIKQIEKGESHGTR
jgi:hypothetical protein